MPEKISVQKQLIDAFEKAGVKCETYVLTEEQVKACEKITREVDE